MRPEAEASGYPIFARFVVRGDGLHGGDSSGAGAGLFFGVAGLFVVPLTEDAGGGGFAAFIFDDFGWWSERAEVGVLGEFFDGRSVGCDVLAEVEAGDLEAVEKEAGAARIDGVGGDALEDFADRELDGGAVFGEGQGEGFFFPTRRSPLGVSPLIRDKTADEWGTRELRRVVWWK